MNMRSRKISICHRGFTLIELLVVIAIIALLMAILMPALQRVKKQAKAVICQSNLKEWGMCYLMYLQENDNKFVVGYDNSVGWASYFTWMDRLRPYFQDDAIFTCPSASKESRYPMAGQIRRGSTFGRWYAENPIIKSIYEGSYGQNYWICETEKTDPWGTSLHWKNTTSSRHPLYNVPLFADCIWIGGYPHDVDTPVAIEDTATTGGNQMTRFCLNRHNGAVNCIFLDNSCRKVGLKELWTLKWHREFDTNGYWTTAGGAVPTDWPEWMKGLKDY